MNEQHRIAFRPNEAAQALGVGRDVIFGLLRTGELRSFQAGRARVIPAEALREWIQRKLQEADGAGNG